MTLANGEPRWSGDIAPPRPTRRATREWESTDEFPLGFGWESGKKARIREGLRRAARERAYHALRDESLRHRESIRRQQIIHARMIRRRADIEAGDAFVRSRRPRWIRDGNVVTWIGERRSAKQPASAQGFMLDVPEPL